jgi:hypothetical protein
MFSGVADIFGLFLKKFKKKFWLLLKAIILLKENNKKSVNTYGEYKVN